MSDSLSGQPSPRALLLSTDGEPFAFDQYPVAIEDDEVKTNHETNVISAACLGSTD